MNSIFALVIVFALIIIFSVVKLFSKPKPKLSICLFYATWCGHCKDYLAAGTFDTTYNSIKENPEFKSVVFKKINSDTDKELTEKYKIEAFPTIIAIDDKQNKISEFTGNRSKPEDLIVFTKSALLST